MSHLQSRGDRSDPQQRRGARSGSGAHQRASTAKGSGAGGQGPSASAAPLLSPAAQPAPVPSSKRSGGVNGQQRGHGPASFETSESQRAQQNTVAHHQAQQVSIPQSGIRPSTLPSNGNVSRSSRPGTPSSSSSVGSTEVAPIIPKPESSWNSAHPQLSFQFGSIGAAYVQIPARTSSAPPNLDEQKQDLLRFEAVNAQAAKLPISSGGQPQGPRPLVQQPGGQQQGFRPQPQQSAAALSSGIPQPPYHQAQQHPMPVQVTQPNAHLQPLPVVTSQQHLQMQAHLVPPQPQQQGLVQLPYSQHTLQSQMQHNGGQVLKYPQSMAGSPLMGPPLAPLPGPMPAPQITQMSHQLPGGLTGTLAPGMPGAPYGVGPVPNPFIPPRTSSAVKIVHPETHEELKFDYKSSKSETYSESGVPVTAAISQVRLAGNGPSHTRSLGYASGVHHPINQNVYAPQQNGPYTPAMQHYYQPPPSGIPTAISGTSASKHSLSEASQGPPEVLSSSRTPSIHTASTVGSREETIGISIAVAPSVSGSSNSVPQSAANEKNSISEKLESAPVISSSSLGAVGEAKESKADVDDKIVKALTTEVSVKEAAEPIKQVQESSVLASSKDSHKTDALVLPIPDVKQSKKKKKKDGPRANSGDALKVSKPLENKKQVEGKISETSKAKLVTPKSVEQVETTIVSPAETSGIFPQPTDVKIEACSCNGEPALDNHSIPAVEQVVSNIQASDNDEMKVSDSTVEAVSVPDDEFLVNSVHKPLVTEPVPNDNENVEIQGDSFTVQVDKHSVDSSEVLVSDVSPESSNPIDTVESPESSNLTGAIESASVLESQESTVEAPVEVNEGASNVREAEGCHETAVSSDANAGGAESSSSNDGCKEEESSQLQNDSVVVQTIVQGEHFVTSSKEESLEDISVLVAPDVKHGSKKKKMKDILAKADAAGTTADLYNAYKAPQEKKLDEPVPSKAGTTKVPIVDPVKQLVPPTETAVVRELDDWEDAVELPSPKVSITEGGDISRTDVSEVNEGETYTRDFLLTFKEQNMELPLDFEVRPDIAELLLNPQAAFARLVDREMHVGSGRMLDRQLSGGPRRSNSSNSFDDDRWARQPQGLHSPLWPESYADMGTAAGFRPGNAQGLIPRMSPNIRPGITVPPLVPGLIPGKPLTPAASPGLFRTNTVDSDRWQRMPTGQKGLIPSPQTSLPPVHKSENRYEVGKISDEEQQKQRLIKGILNKLTPQNFQKLFEQVKDVNIQSAITLTGVISQIFDKALTEPTFCEMYATFCKQLAADMPEFVEDGDKVTFKRVLLNKCQEEFHRGEREQAEASAVEEEGKEKMTPEEREEKRVTAKRRMLGNIRFIGELFKKHMLTERIMHECIRKLLGEYENPEEEDVEALCKLMSTIGIMIDQPKTRGHIDAYLERITRLSNNQKLSARIRFMLKDLIDLRRNGWQERRKVEGPKRIEEVHRDAVQERQATVAQAGRLSRGPSIGASSGRRLVPPPELNTRGTPSPMFSPNTPMGATPGMRGAQSQIGIRSPYVQDVRMEDRLLMDSSRPTPMPLSQRPVDEGPLTLGPQGGLGRGMSLRSQGAGRNFSTDATPGVASSESRRFGPVSMPAYSGGPLGVERPLTPPERPLLDRPAAPADRLGSGSSNRSLRHLERTLSDRAVSTSTASISQQQQQGPSSRPSTAPAHMPLSEEQLRKKSEAALIEYFSAHDLKEAAQCVEDLKAPRFYPTMVCTWIGLSFEKKDLERELLAKLLINLHKSEPFLLKQEQISQGFEMIMESLEDLALDTPKAPEYLAEMLVMLTSAGTLALDQIGALLKKEDLLQSGFGLDMIGKVLAGLRLDRGERSLVEMFRSSGIRLEDFFISGSSGSKSLSEFLQKYNLQCFGPEPDDGTSISAYKVGIQLLEHFNKNEPALETVRWLEKSIAPPMQSDSSFLQMLMTQVLKHSIPAGSFEKDIVKERISHHKILLTRFATDKEKQRQYIVAMQLFVHDIGHPSGLMTTLFNTFYEEEVISESAYSIWEDDVNDPTLGRDKALRDVYRWLQWLRTAPEQSQDDEL